MVTDAELVAALRAFLRASDLATTTTAIVRRKLEEDFGVDLTEKKAFIREQVDLFLQSELECDRKDDDEDDAAAKEHAEAEEEEEEEEDEEEEEEEDDDDDESSGGSSRKRKLNKVNKEGKRKAGGFTKLCSLSPQLQEFVGVSELARTEVVKKIWAYIRDHKLQDPNNKRKIICDERLQTLFDVNSIDMFQMNKALSKHIWPLTSEDGPIKMVQKEKQRKKEKVEGSDELPRKEKRRKGGFLAPLSLSDALVKFFGTGENELPRADVVKRMWDYIKQNNLQDPADKRKVICDEKLKELFNVDSFHGFSVTKLLTAHLVKTEQ